MRWFIPIHHFHWFVIIVVTTMKKWWEAWCTRKCACWLREVLTFAPFLQRLHSLLVATPWYSDLYGLLHPSIHSPPHYFEHLPTNGPISLHQPQERLTRIHTFILLYSSIHFTWPWTYLIIPYEILHYFYWYFAIYGIRYKHSNILQPPPERIVEIELAKDYPSKPIINRNIIPFQPPLQVVVVVPSHP